VGFEVKLYQATSKRSSRDEGLVEKRVWETGVTGNVRLEIEKGSLELIFSYMT
jgi:hypothetical protein